MTRRARAPSRLDPRTARSLWLVGVTLAACAPLLAAFKHADAKAARDAALHAHGLVMADARRLLDLTPTPAPGTPGSAHGTTSESAMASTTPSPDLVARVRDTMRAVGIPESSLREARQVEPAPLRSAPGRTPADPPNAELVRLSGSATITQVRPADAARLLARWRVAEPSWIVRTVALRASPTRTRDEVVDMFDLDLSFEAVAPAPGSAPSVPLPPPSREPPR